MHRQILQFVPSVSALQHSQNIVEDSQDELLALRYSDTLRGLGMFEADVVFQQVAPRLPGIPYAWAWFWPSSTSLDTVPRLAMCTNRPQLTPWPCGGWDILELGLPKLMGETDVNYREEVLCRLLASRQGR